MILKVLALVLLVQGMECSFLISGMNSSNKTFVYYSPIGSLVNHTIAHHICANVGGSIVTMQTDEEIILAPEFFKTTVWLSFAPVANVPESSAPQYRYSWPDGNHIDPTLWSNTPSVAPEVAEESTPNHEVCKALIYDQSISALDEIDCNRKSAAVCKTEVDTKQEEKILKLLPDQERNNIFEPLPSKLGKLVAILSKTDEGPSTDQINKATIVMKKANVALEERQKIKMMNQLIEAHNLRTTSALTLGYCALGFAFAVVVLLVLIVAGTLIKKPDIRFITLPGSRKNSTKSNRPTKEMTLAVNRANGKTVEFADVVTTNGVDQSSV